MPITFQFDPRNQVVLTRATGLVTYPDLVEYLRAIADAGLFAHPQLFNAMDIHLDLSIQDLHRIAAETRRLLAGERMGKVAVVTNSFYFHAIATAYASITQKENPEFRIFKSVAAAQAWLGVEAPVAHT